jgi:hypothetical protein
MKTVTANIPSVGTAFMTGRTAKVTTAYRGFVKKLNKVISGSQL